MTLFEFLLLDGLVVLLAIPLWLIFQARKSRSLFLGNLNNNKTLNPNPIIIPSLQELLELEQLSRKEGSGIEFGSLIGLWKFAFVWKPGTDKEDLLASSLLRLFSAHLELTKHPIEQELFTFEIMNSIEFGALSISFIGLGQLKESQSLLSFFFERVELKFGSSVVFRRTLEIPEEKNRPFFFLIAMEESRRWLSARGRGGGLALWFKD